MIHFEGKTKSGDDYVIRDVEMRDVSGLVEYINTLSNEQTYILLQGEQKTIEEEKSYVEDLLSKMSKNLIVALVVESKGKIIGHTTFGMRTRVESHVGSIGISLSSDYRDQGIGRILLSKLIEIGKQKLQGLKIIELGVFGNNERAIHLYQSLGFIKYGVLPKGINHKGQFIDHIFMYQAV